MDDTDLIPVREMNGTRNVPKTAAAARLEDGDAAGQRNAQQRRMVAKWNRDDLEDKYFRMYEENIILKKHARKQEDKIKRMATKLLRLVNDKKKSDQDTGIKKVRDIETEEMLEELHEKIRDYEKQNHQLKEKLMVTKQQLATQGKRTTKFDYVPARINTGIPKAPTDPRITKNIRVMAPKESARSIQNPGLPRYGHSLLEDARAENKHLEDVIAQMNEQLNIYEQDIETLKEQNRIREAEHEEDILKIKQHISQGQRNNIQENIEIIRLQREVKDKGTRFTALQSQYSNMEEKLSTLKASHKQVLNEMEKQNQQLKEEESRVLILQNQLKNSSQHQRAMIELKERAADLENEKKILQEANENLMTSAFDLEREREWRQRENALKVQIAQLEATLKADVGEKGGILDKLAQERDKQDSLEEEMRELRVKYFQVKQDHDNLTDKMKFFTQESAVDFQEIEEALMIVKTRKEKGSQDLDFLVKVDDESQKDLQKALVTLEAEHAETISELEKTRNMLIVQHKINKDYQMEVEAVTQKMEDNKGEYESKLQEYAQLLDIRAVRIKKLESQMRDVAYGTRQHRIRDQEEDEVEEIDETLHLERGQNIFEIHIKKVVLSPDGLRQMADEEPSIFCTWEFYEFEIQSTPVLKSPKPEYDFTSQYQVTIDDFFLHFLMKDSTTLELHQSFGNDYRTVAACQLKFRDILEKSQGRIFGTAQLLGVDNSATGVNYGTVEYWIRLRVPMDQALRLYKEKTKALGYLHTNLRATEQSLQALDDNVARQPEDNVNEVHIKIIRCTDVKSRREGVQPAPYCVYKFFDFSDHDTTIVPGSNSPQFNDHKTFPVPMTADLDKYLKSKPLQIYVFDDVDPEETSYLGCANVPLIPLSHDKAIKGTFELKKSDGSVNGSIDIQLNWQYTYIPPRASTKTPAQILATTPEKREQIPLMPGEEMTDTSIVSAPVTMTTLPATVTFSMPSSQSTPLKPEPRHAQAEQPQAEQPQAAQVVEKPPKPSPRQKGATGPIGEQMAQPQKKPREAPIEPPQSVQMDSELIHETAVYQEDGALQESATVMSDVASEGTPVSGESEPVSSAGEESGRGTPTPITATPLSVGTLPAAAAAATDGQTDDDGNSTDTLVEEDEEDEMMESSDDDAEEMLSGPASVTQDAGGATLNGATLTTEAVTPVQAQDVSQIPRDLPVKPAIHHRGNKNDMTEQSSDKEETVSESVKKEAEMEEDLSDVDSIEEDIEDTAQGQSTLEDTTQGQSTLEDTTTQSGERGESALDDTQSAVPESTLDDTQSSPAEGATDDKDAEVTQETQEPEPEPEEKQKKSKFSIKSIFSRKGKDKEKGKEKEKDKDKKGKKAAKVPEKEVPPEVVDEIESSAPNTARDDIQSSDSEGVVTASPKSRPTSSAQGKLNVVTVEVAHLTLDEDNPITDNDDVRMLFVEYRFLNRPLGELETPFSLPKPKPNHKITFNFKKVFHVDFKENYESRQYLASMLLPDDPDDGRICFTIVSEPPEDLEDGECEDVGVSYVSIRDILKNNKDLINADVPIYDIGKKKRQIGMLNLTVEALDALKAVEQEMKSISDEKTV